MTEVIFEADRASSRTTAQKRIRNRIDADREDLRESALCQHALEKAGRHDGFPFGFDNVQAYELKIREESKASS